MSMFKPEDSSQRLRDEGNARVHFNRSEFPIFSHLLLKHDFLLTPREILYIIFSEQKGLMIMSDCQRGGAKTPVEMQLQELFKLTDPKDAHQIHESTPMKVIKKLNFL